MQTDSEPLSKTRYGNQNKPLIVLWGARALYVGPAFDLSPHRSAVAVLAIGIDGPFGVANDPLGRQQRCSSCRTALIKPNTLHQLRATGTMAFLYLDPLSRDYQAVQDWPRRAADDVTSVIACLAALRCGTKSWHETGPELVQRLGLQDTLHIDKRIADAICDLRSDPSRQQNAVELARDADLSVSRFLHVFKEATGVPFRRYRMWCRLSAVVRLAANGTSLTAAAHATGLASSAHLSAAFREMFGLTPSDLGLRNVRLILAD